MLVVFSCPHYLCGFKVMKKGKQHCCCFINGLCCLFRRISSWSVEALFLLFVNDMWSVYTELLIP
jgi:fluoride ion exporter CrcB/FEX